MNSTEEMKMNEKFQVMKVQSYQNKPGNIGSRDSIKNSRGSSFKEETSPYKWDHSKEEYIERQDCEM